jgi:hypothetical protein
MRATGSFLYEGDCHLDAACTVKEHGIVRQRDNAHRKGNLLARQSGRYSLSVPALIRLSDGSLQRLAKSEAGC